MRDIDKTTGSEREVVGVYFCARRKVCVCVCGHGRHPFVSSCPSHHEPLLDSKDNPVTQHIYIYGTQP